MTRFGETKLGIFRQPNEHGEKPSIMGRIMTVAMVAVLFAATSLAQAQTPSEEPAGKRPNFVFFLVDDKQQ